MNTATTIAIVLAVLVVLGLILLASTARRRDNGDATGGMSRETIKRDKRGRKKATVGASSAATETRAAREPGTSLEQKKVSAPVAWTPPDPEAIGVARRQFMNRGIVGGFVLGIGSFGGAVVAMLWPGASSGFGADLNIGKIGDVQAAIQANNGFLYNAEGRMWVTEYPTSALPKAQAAYSAPELAGMQVGLVALYQKCPHLGCRVPECSTSQWFECPCHGSQYNQVGEKKGGPAPRGMDRFAMQVNADQTFTVKTGTIVNGPPIGTNTTGQESEGAHCIGSSDDH